MVTQQIGHGIVRLYDPEYEVGYITPNAIGDGIEQLIFFRRNACNVTQDPAGGLILTETGVPEHVPMEGDRIAYEAKQHSKGVIAIKWFFESQIG